MTIEAPAAPPREDLLRSVPFHLVRAEGDQTGDGLTLEGYAAVFDTPTRIDSWEGTFDEQIAPGAFRKTLRERTPVMQFDHGHHPLIGSIPIGTLTSAAEDARGLYVSGRLTDNWLIEPVRDAVRDGAVNGMSFRFSVVRDEWRDADGKVIRDANELMELLWNPGDRGPMQRTLKEVKVAELGPVVFPAYAETSVSVRSRPVIEALQDPEIRRDALRVLMLRTEVSTFAQPDTRTEIEDEKPDAVTPAAPPPAEERDGHPADVDAEGSDAPPRDGHPSAEPQPSRLDPARLRRDAAFRAEYLALITKGSERYER